MVSNLDSTARAGKISKPSGLRDRQKELTRRSIIDAAMQAFAEKGVISATMDDIASIAVMNRGTIYLYFSNKMDILLGALAEGPSPRALLDELGLAKDRGQVRQVFSRMYDYWTVDISPFWTHVRQAALVDPRVNEWLVTFISVYAHKMQNFFEEYGVDAELASARAMLLNLMISEFIYRNAFPSDSAFNREPTVTALTDFYISACSTASNK